MKLLFFGDCMFGRDGNPFVLNPFQNVKNILKQADYVFFNLETVISPIPIEDKFKDIKTFNYQSTGEQLIQLRKIIKVPIFVSIANNHSLDYGKKGFQETKKFLNKYKFLSVSGKQTVCKNNICFINVSDHCGCKDIEKWGKHIWIINHNNISLLLKKVKNLSQKNKFIVISIHWGDNYIIQIPNFMKKIGKLLIDNGADIIFGHSAHHIPPISGEIYKNGIIIYGLGDFINDYAISKKFKSNEALMYLIDTNKKLIEIIKIKRKFIQQSSIPVLS